MNYYKNPINGRYRTTPRAGYTDREIGSYNGFGRMVDTTGPGRTHRCKPDIISAQGTDHQFIAWPAVPEADNTNNWVSNPNLTEAYQNPDYSSGGKNSYATDDSYDDMCYGLYD